MEVCDPQPPPPAAPFVPPPPAMVERPRRAKVNVPRRLTPARLALVAGAAVAGDVGLQAAVTNIAAFVSILLAATALAGLTRASRASRVLLVAAIAVAVWLPIRASGWLLALNGGTSLALLLAASLAGASGVSPTHLVDLIRRTTLGFFGPIVLARSLVPTRSSATIVGPLLRGAAIAAVPLLVLGSILASADAVFATYLRPGFDLWSLVGHGVVAVVFGSGLAGLICVASDTSSTERAPRRLLGAVEALVVLSSVAVLFGLFATSQLVGAFTDIDTVLAEANLTRSEYAREGFFQLLWVAALTLILLVVMRGASDPGRGRVAIAQSVAGAVVSALTVLIVAVAIIRLRLYVDAFGQTTLRWYCVAFAAMLGVVFVLLAVRFALPTKHPFFGWASAATVVATLLFVNIANPDARVAEHNLRRTDIALDADYLTGLSADAWPTILDERHRVLAVMPEGRADYSVDWIAPEDNFWERCNDADRTSYGLAGFNLARNRLRCD